MTETLFRLDEKAAAVVGAAHGIGRAIAEGLAGQGATVDCLDIDLIGARDTADAIEKAGGRAAAAAVDVRVSASLDSALADVVDRRGRLDIAICTPGINIRKPLLRYTDADYADVTDVNLRGSFHVLRGAGRIMARQRSGSIVVISSISARVVEPGQVIYAGTKAAIAQMIRVLAAELGPYGVRVNALAPGPVATELTVPIRQDPDWNDAYASKIAVGRWATPAELVAPAVFLASPSSTYVNGEVLYVDGGWMDLARRFQGGAVLEELDAPRESMP